MCVCACVNCRIRERSESKLSARGKPDLFFLFFPACLKKVGRPVANSLSARTARRAGGSLPSLRILKRAHRGFKRYSSASCVYLLSVTLRSVAVCVCVCVGCESVIWRRVHLSCEASKCLERLLFFAWTGWNILKFACVLCPLSTYSY